ncbi:hypothetical protein [Streptomyces sp. NBC_00459]|uniref:hypothetical protein n=1 Tax=Streptomyces sp. NBC_00459 TaxID=2975749 RepID=UPI002E182465
MTVQTVSLRTPAGTARLRPRACRPLGNVYNVTQDVVEPLLRRADLLSQILRLGYACDLRGQEV